VSDATTTPPVPEESSQLRTSGDLPVTTRDIGAAMAVLARTLQREHSSEPATLQAVTTAAVLAVPPPARDACPFLGQAQTQRVTHTHEVNQGPTRCRPCLQKLGGKSLTPAPPHVRGDRRSEPAARHQPGPGMEPTHCPTHWNAGTRPSLGRPSDLGVSRFLGTVLDLNVEPSEVSVDPG